LFDFHLTDAEMNQIATLGKNMRIFTMPEFVQRPLFSLMKLNYDAQE